MSQINLLNSIISVVNAHELEVEQHVSVELGKFWQQCVVQFAGLQRDLLDHQVWLIVEGAMRERIYE